MTVRQTDVQADRQTDSEKTLSSLLLALW